MGELLLELLSEEIPARMQRRASEDLVGLIRDKLAAAEIPAASVAGYGTPRRLTVIADGIPATQPDRNEERRGPRVGAPEAALNGFLRAAGLKSIDQCEVRGEFYFAVMRRQGQATTAVLPGLVAEAVGALSWPKSMRFPAAELRWVRPLSSVICLFDGHEVPFPLGTVPVGRVTQGHRFLSPGEISVADAADYRAKLTQANVVLDRNERRAAISQALDARAAAEGMTVKPDVGLLEEVTGLVEYPVVLSGTIDADFMDLPPEVLSTSMRTHQKYFSVLNPDGSPAPRFLFVANNRTEDGGAAISAGNERVLRARLSDARFFWDQDRKVRLEDRVDALKDRVFHAKLGSVYDKVERVEKLAEYIAVLIGAAHQEARQAAHLAKADLSTGMVGEFPELQGVMGQYYALNDGCGPVVADAIGEHYKPLGPSDSCPRSREAAAVALADKLDTIAAFFSVDERPTGSRDPFALRRAALGVIRIILDHGLRGELAGWIAQSMQPFRGASDPVFQQVCAFITDRLRVHLREQGTRHDIIAAIVEHGFGRGESDLVRLVARVSALELFLTSPEGTNLSGAYRRASSILTIEEERDARKYEGPIQRTRLQSDAERVLAARLDVVRAQVGSLLSREQFTDVMAELAQLRQPVDEFFEKVTVNVDDTALRENRLRLLSRIRATMNQVADFSQIEG